MKFWGGFGRQAIGRLWSSCYGGLRAHRQFCASHSSDTRVLSFIAGGGGSSHFVRNYINYSRDPGLNAEDQLSNKISNMLRLWTPSTATDLERLGVQWNPFVVCRVLKSKINADQAWEFFTWVKTQKDYDHNVYTFTSMIDQFGKAKKYDAMESLAEQMRQEGCPFSVVTYTALIHWYRHAKNVDSARRVWKEMEEKACKPNVVTYTAYIDALVKDNCHLEAMEVYKGMQEAGCRPNIYTYTVLIHSLVEAGKLDAATDLFNKLGTVKCKPNSVTYNLLIGAYSKAGNVEKALSLYKAMRESGIGSSHETRGSVARALEGIGMVEEAQQLLSGVDDYTILVKIDRKGLSADDPALTDPVTSSDALEPGRLPKPMQLAGRLRVWGPETDALLAQVGTRLRPPYVMNVLKELRRDSAVAWRFFQWAGAQEGYKHTQYTFMKMMEIVGRVTKAGSNDLMDKMLAELEKEEMANVVSFNTLIKYYAESKNITSAEEVFKRMKAAEFKPNEVTYTMLIDMYSKADMHYKSMEIYKEMQIAECKPTLHTLTVVIHSIARSGNIAEAESIFESMPSLGLQPNVLTYTVLMQSLLKAGEVERTLALLQRMKDAGVQPTHVTLKVLMKGLRFAGHAGEADKIAQSVPYLKDESTNDDESQGARKGEKGVRELMSLSFSDSPDLPNAEGQSQALSSVNLS